MVEDSKLFVVQTDERVYSPSEDSYLLLDSMKVGKGNYVLDMGTGTGIIAITAASRGASKVVAIDINPFACLCALKNVTSKGLESQISVLMGDLFSPLRRNAAFDVIVFNPPYLRTVESEYTSDWLEKAWAGGRNGRLIINQFIDKMPTYLRSRGFVYLLLPSSGLSYIIKKLRQTRMSASVIAKKKLFFEELAVLLITHK